MSALYLDTHAVVWLYEKKLDKFPPRVLAMLERHELLVSPMLVLEIGYLFETGRITERAERIIDYLKARINLALCPAPFGDVIKRALAETWTRDPFDRIITAQARFADAPLVTKDRVILENYDKAVWE